MENRKRRRYSGVSEAEDASPSAPPALLLLLLLCLNPLLRLLSPPSPLKAERQEERAQLLVCVCVCACAGVCTLPCDPRHLWLFYFGGGNRKQDEQRCRLVPFSRERSGFHAAAPTRGTNLANKRQRYKGAAGVRSANKTNHQKYTNQQLVPQPVKLEINTFETRIDASINSVRMLMQRQTSASETHSGGKSFPQKGLFLLNDPELFGVDLKHEVDQKQRLCSFLASFSFTCSLLYLPFNANVKLLADCFNCSF